MGQIMTKVIQLIGGLIWLYSGIASASIIYDASEHFKTVAESGDPTLNSAMVWQLGVGTNSADFQIFDRVSFPFGATNWQRTNLNWPGSILNNTSGAITIFGDVVIPKDGIWVHPGNGDNLSAILRFLAPSTGTYAFDSLFTAVDSSSAQTDGNVKVIVESLNSTLDSMTIDANDGNLQRSFTFSRNLTLMAGQTVDFIVSRADDQYFNDSTILSASATFTSVSEPNVLVLFFIPFVLLLRKRFTNRM